MTKRKRRWLLGLGVGILVAAICVLVCDRTLLRGMRSAVERGERPTPVALTYVGLRSRAARYESLPWMTSSSTGFIATSDGTRLHIYCVDGSQTLFIDPKPTRAEHAVCLEPSDDHYLRVVLDGQRLQVPWRFEELVRLQKYGVSAAAPPEKLRRR